MDINQPPPGKVPDLTGLTGEVSVGLARRRPWLWRFLGICLLAAVVAGPASLAGGVHQETSPSAKVQNNWLTVSARPAEGGGTIDFGPLPNQIIGAEFTLSASAPPPLPVLFKSGTTSVCTLSRSADPGGLTWTVTAVAVGVCTITAYDDDEDTTPVTQSFQVNPAAQTITFGQPPDVTVGVPVTLSASASSGLPVSFSSGTPSVCTVKGSAVTTVAAGPCTITASQAGSTDYAAAPSVTQSFQVNPARADDHFRAAA